MGVSNNLRRLAYYLQREGIPATMARVFRFLMSRVIPKRADLWPTCSAIVDGKSGMEIGGPSRFFSRTGQLPIYRLARRVDNCNFASQTVWEGAVKDGAPFGYGRRRNLGIQYVREAVDLHGISDEHYDFLCSSHTLEHVANPLKALGEWCRILREGGTMILVLPHYEATFDHRRPVTTLAHLIDDHARDMGEDDLSHLAEILALHDFNRSPEISQVAPFERRSRDNYVNRCLHHHVFDTDLAVRLIDHAGLTIRAVEPVLPNSIVIVARKLGGRTPDNRSFLAADAQFRRCSPFRTDRIAPAATA